MSYFDDASLVMIPSGYKTSKVYSVKPTDGSGDLTFSRSNDTATRVNSAGLIEKVRTNLALYSEDFTNAYWVKSNASVTANTMANPINGALTADTITMSAVTGQIYVNLPRTFVTSDTTISFFIKNNGADRVQLLFGSLASLQFANFNLVTGTITGGTYGAASITPLTNGFFRISLTAPVASTAFVSEAYLWFIDSDTAPRAAASTGDGVKGVFAFGAQLETDVLTDYIGPTLGSAVSVGPVANVPRLDYLNSSCPRLLLEPQRTNIVTFSEQIDNAAWVKTNATITANASPSPDGYQNADLFVPASGTTGRVEQTTSTASANNTTYTESVYFKKPTLAIDNITFYISDGSSALGSNRFGITVNLTNFTGTAFNFGNGVTTSVNVVSVGNDWYRAIFTGSVTSGATGNWAFAVRVLTTNATINGTNGLLIWGAQLEAGAYATSYIPTLGAAVTRGADECSKTGISSLIGQTEGVLFVDFVPNNTPAAGVAQWLMFLGAGTNFISIYIVNQKLLGSIANTTDQCSIFTSYNLQAGTRYKAALAYKANDFAFYVNGVQIGVDTSGTVPAVSTLQNNYNTTAANSVNAGLNQALLFKTRLSNSSLAELTSL